MSQETIVAENWSDLKEHRKRLAGSHVSLSGGIVSFDHRARPSDYWLDLARRFAPAALQPISLKRPEGPGEGQYVEYHLDKALSRPLHVFSEGELNFLEALSHQPAKKTDLPLLLHQHGASRNPHATHSSVLTRLSNLNSKSIYLGWGRVVCSIPVGSDQYVFGVPHENAMRLNLPLVASVESHLAERNREIISALRRTGPSTPNEMARILGLPVEKNTAKAILDSVNTVNNVSVFFHGKKMISVGRYGKGSKKSMYKLWLTEETPEGGPRWKFTDRQEPYLRAIDEKPGITIAELAAKFGVKFVFAWQRVNELRTARFPGHEGPVVIAGGMQGDGGGLILSPTFAKENGFAVVADPIPLLLPRSLRFLYPHFLAGRIQKDGTGRVPGARTAKIADFLRHMEKIRRSLEPHRRLLRPGLARMLFGNARPAANKSLAATFRELTAGDFSPKEVRAKVLSHIASMVSRRLPASRTDAKALGVRLVGSFYNLVGREVGRLDRQAAKLAPDSQDGSELSRILQRRELFMNLRRP